MGFQKFEAFGARMAPRVSIRSNGQIGLSAGALRLFGIEGAGWKMELYFDTDSRMVGFKPTKDEAAVHAAPVLVRDLKVRGKLTGAKYGQISGWSFLERFQIPFKDDTRAYDATFDKANGLFVIDLKKERVPRRKKSAPVGGGDGAAAGGAAGVM